VILARRFQPPWSAEKLLTRDEARRIGGREADVLSNRMGVARRTNRRSKQTKIENRLRRAVIAPHQA
jgi:hypothetical protein